MRRLPDGCKSMARPNCPKFLVMAKVCSANLRPAAERVLLSLI